MTILLPGNILYGGPVEIVESTNFKSVGHIIMEKLKTYRDRTLMIDALKDKNYTAQELYTSITRMAYILKYLGIKSNDVVCISSENSIEFAITLFAAFALNATVAPINVSYTESEIHHALNLSKPKIIFASQISIQRIIRAAKRNSFVEKIVVFGSSATTSDVYSFSQLMESEKIPSRERFECTAANKDEDVVLIVCSSGTTGLAKGVQLTHRNILSLLDIQVNATTFLEGYTILSVLPWFHVFGCVYLISGINKGTVCVYLPKFQDHAFLSAIEKYRVKMALMVPPLMVFLAKHPMVDKYDLSSLMSLNCGAAPLSKEIIKQIKKRLGVPNILQGYGLSECTAGAMAQTENNCKPGSVGVLRMGVYAKVIDPNTGKVLGPNERGELCLKADTVMKGYIGDTASTRSTIIDGWLHTGDVGYYDEHFEFFIVDRLKELIKYKGFQVAPAEIEALLLTHPKIKDAAVIGKPDEEAGELPMAVVVKQDNVQLSEEEVKDFVDQRASATKKLRGGVLFLDEIPKNPAGKILRRKLRDLTQENVKAKL